MDSWKAEIRSGDDLRSRWEGGRFPGYNLRSDLAGRFLVVRFMLCLPAISWS
jgi:hypothetical protein